MNEFMQQKKLDEPNKWINEYADKPTRQITSI